MRTLTLPFWESAGLALVGSVAFVNVFESTKLTVVLAPGASSPYDFDVASAVTLSGSGNLTGSGTAETLRVTLSGSGNAWFTRLVADDVRAVLSGSGNIYVTANGSLDASVPGSGTIVYAGSPQEVTKSVTGSGVVTGS